MKDAGEQNVIVVVGMRREARIVGPRARVLIGRHEIGDALSNGATGLLSFGICGGLDPALRVGDLVVGTGVVTETEGRIATDLTWSGRLAAALPSAARREFAASDTIVASPAEKAALRTRLGGGCVDMESRAVADVAARTGLPFAIVRAVSDTAGHALPSAALAGFGDDGEANIGAVIATLSRRPLDLFPLIRTAFRANRAIRALECVADTVLAISP